MIRDPKRTAGMMRYHLKHNHAAVEARSWWPDQDQEGARLGQYDCGFSRKYCAGLSCMSPTCPTSAADWFIKGHAMCS